MRRPLFLLLALLFLQGGASAENRAFVALISEYPNKQDTLVGKVFDPPMIDAVLAKLGFKPDQIRYVRDAQATRQGVMDGARQWLTQGVGKDDKVVFLYSGHGTRIPDDNGDEEDGCDEALYAYDGVIRDDDIAKLMDQIPAAETLALFDSCFSGTVTRALASPQTAGTQRQSSYVALRTPCDQAINYEPPRLASERGATRQQGGNPDLIEFSAAQNNEVGWVFNKSGSVFMMALYERLVRDGRPVTLSELRDFTVDYISKKVVDDATPYKDASTPFLSAPEAWKSMNVLDFGKFHLPNAPQSDPPPVDLASDPATAFQVINSNRTTRLEFVSTQRQYALKQPIGYSLVSPFGGWLNVLELNPDGTVTLLFPNKYATDNQVKAGQKVTLPGKNFNIVAVEPTGQSRLLAIITNQHTNLYSSSIIPLDDGFRYAISREDFALFLKGLPLTTTEANLPGQVMLKGDARFASEVIDVTVTR